MTTTETDPMIRLSRLSAPPGWTRWAVMAPEIGKMLGTVETEGRRRGWTGKVSSVSLSAPRTYRAEAIADVVAEALELIRRHQETL